MAQVHPLSLLTSLPVFTSAEELQQHQQATPESFAIPAILRKKENGLTMQLNPPLSGFSELAEGVKGDLYVSEASLVFFSTALSKGISVPYPAIALHAISRQPMRPWQPAEGSEGAVEAPLADVGLAGGPCIFCQIDELGGERPENEEIDDEDGMLRDMILTPEDAAAIEPIFEALSYCASLFPSTLSDDEEPAFADADVNGHVNGDVEDSEVGAAAREHLDSLVDWSSVPARAQAASRTAEMHPEAYADAEEEQEETGP